VSLVDIMPTILGASGIKGPESMEGYNVLNLIDSGAAKREAVYAEFYEKRSFNVQVARRTRSSKVIQHFNRITNPKSPVVELYDLTQDPKEADNLANRYQDRARNQLDITAAWLAKGWKVQRGFEALSERRSHTIEIDHETAERLRALGYVGD